MTSRQIARLIFVFTFAVLIALPGFARGKAPKTEPGTYKDWAGEVDELEIVESFALGDYANVVVLPFDASETPLPEEKDNTFEPVKKVLEDTSEPLANGIRENIGRDVTLDVQASANAPREAKTLIVRGKVEAMDPGSKAARYWAGFGAGAARTKLVGEVVDAKSGKVLFKFTQERRSGVGMMGGDYVDLMNRNLHAIGEDVALVLKAFAKQ